MTTKSHVVITSIAGPDTPALRVFARQCAKQGVAFTVVGDAKSPAGFHLDNCDFWGFERGKRAPFTLAGLLRANSYARKNIGYLVAIQGGADAIIETDDDTIPKPEFWHERSRDVTVETFENAGWVNAYRYFTDRVVWPRGFALEKLFGAKKLYGPGGPRTVCAPIQQGLIDKNPDVDAIFRLTLPLPVFFEKKPAIALGAGCICPLNSQNTTWFKEAFALLYLPSYCGFRMTDIWRGLIAQRIAWTCGWHVLHHGATVFHERNLHNLFKDLSDEVPGYLHIGPIARELRDLDLPRGVEAIGQNLLTCYSILIERGCIGKREMRPLTAWLHDIAATQ
jgi:hypothetical protein